MNHDWHVLYSRYLERVWAGAVVGATPSEKVDAKIMHDVAEDEKLRAIGQMWEAKRFPSAPDLDRESKPGATSSSERITAE